MPVHLSEMGPVDPLVFQINCDLKIEIKTGNGQHKYFFCCNCHGVKFAFECESAWSSNHFTFERARVHIGTLTKCFRDHFILFFCFFSVFAIVRNSILSGDSGQYSLSSISLSMHDVMAT